MYQNYFGLAEAPFSIAPDPRYLYMSQRHQEALAHLLYGVNGGGGFVLLTGEVGAGKTTVCRCLLEQIPASCDVAYIFNPKLTVAELLSTICAEFGITCPSDNTSIKVFIDSINAYLLDAHARGRHTVLIIDEAQNLSADVLEQMRLLTNLETNQRKLLQIILLGQPELAQMLERSELRQLAQRIIARYHLAPLTKGEVASYIRHRLEISGTQRQLFPATLMGQLFRLSSGIPRIINVLCDRALLGAYVQGKERVDRKTLAQAAREIFYQPPARRNNMMRAFFAVIILAAGTGLVAAMYQHRNANTAAVLPKTVAATTNRHEDAGLHATLPTPLEWPSGEPHARSKEIAYATLFKAWGLDYQGEDACRQAESTGLRCRTARSGLDELRQSNRPAILQMQDSQGRQFFATLTALEDNAATFTIGKKSTTVGLDALAGQWSGHYTLLWRLPPDARKSIRPGERGPAVAWLGKQLAQAQGRAEASGETVFDESMASRIKQFQLAQGLAPDGALGPQTLMRLSRVADQTAPRLFREQGGR